MNLGNLGLTACRSQGWIKAEASGGSTCCVLVKLVSDRIVALADSKNRRHPGYVAHFEPIITLTKSGWDDLRRQLTTAEPLDLVSHVEIDVEHWADGTVALTSNADGTTLTYLPEEWRVFVEAIRSGETLILESTATPALT